MEKHGVMTSWRGAEAVTWCRASHDEWCALSLGEVRYERAQIGRYCHAVLKNTHDIRLSQFEN